MLARLQTVLLLIAIVATPPDVVTRVSAKTQDACHGMCCPARGAQGAADQRQARAASHRSGTSCPFGIAGHLAICVGKSKHKVVYEIVAPLRPAVLSEHPSLAGPQFSSHASPLQERFLFPGFFPPPFEPPRS
jgi:hypothetical protein